MTRRKYNITIHTSRVNGMHSTFSNVAYPKKPYSKSGDEIKVYTQKVVISTKRNRKYDDDAILEYKQNSIYQQIFKSLLYIFLSRGKRIKIRSIDIECGSKIKNIPIEINAQPLEGDFELKYPVPNDVLNVLFEESIKGSTLRTATSHYLIAISTKDRYKRFERLWRSFEQISIWHKYHEGRPRLPNDFEVLREMRNYFETMPHELGHTFNIIDRLNSRDISKLHWKRMVENNFPYTGEARQITNLYDELFDKNRDVRLVRVYNKIRAIRSSAISAHNRGHDFDTLIQSYLASKIKNNSHVLSLIVCKYCYFMRNKMFHGEEADFSFCFTNHTEDDDITDFLNNILTILVNELIVGYNSL